MISEKQIIEDIDDAPDSEYDGDVNESRIFKDTNLLNYIDEDREELDEMQEINDLIGDALNSKASGNEIMDKFKEINDNLAREKR